MSLSLSLFPNPRGSTFGALLGMYNAADAKNPAVFQEKFYQLPKDFRERIKSMNLEFDSNDTDARLSYCMTVIERLAKEEFDQLSPVLKEKASRFSMAFAKREAREKLQDKTFSTIMEREEEISKMVKESNPKDETRRLLCSLGFVIRNPNFDTIRRFKS